MRERTNSGTTNTCSLSLSNSEHVIQLSLYDNHLLFIHSDFISGQFDLNTSVFSVTIFNDKAVFECRSDNHQTIIQRWFINTNQAPLLADFLAVAGIKPQPLKEVLVSDSDAQINCITNGKVNLDIDLTFKRPDIMIQTKTKFCHTLIDRDKVGIEMTKHEHSHLGFHLQDCGQTYQKWIINKDDHEAIRDYFREMRFPVPDYPTISI